MPVYMQSSQLYRHMYGLQYRETLFKDKATQHDIECFAAPPPPCAPPPTDRRSRGDGAGGRVSVDVRPLPRADGKCSLYHITYVKYGSTGKTFCLGPKRRIGAGTYSYRTEVKLYCNTDLEKRCSKSKYSTRGILLLVE